MVMGAGVVMAVAHEITHINVRTVLPRCSQEPVESRERERAVALAASRHDGGQRKVVTVLRDDNMVVPVAEDMTAVSRVVTPHGSAGLVYERGQPQS